MDFQFLFMVGLIFLSLFGAGAFYFARYYVKVDGSDEGGNESELPSHPEPRPGRVKDLREALVATRSGILGRIQGLFQNGGLSENHIESLEDVLYTSDIGPKTAHKLVLAASEAVKGSDRSDFEKVRGALRQSMLDIFSKVESVDPNQGLQGQGPFVWMVVGVNGVGKTTTIGKLAHRVAATGKKVLVVAGDTYRAAAGDQLKVWAERAGAEFFSPPGVSDPGAVVFDGVQFGKARSFDLVLVDTAGRLHTQSHLMEELKKIKRVIGKALPGAPHEVLIVLDANSGQNALQQAREFHGALGLTGTVLTKLDGSARGGVAFGLVDELELPISLIGVGESIEDLRSFQPQEYVSSILDN